MSTGRSSDRAEWESSALRKARERSAERRDSFETSSRIPIQPLYTQEDLAEWDAASLAQLTPDTRRLFRELPDAQRGSYIAPRSLVYAS